MTSRRADYEELVARVQQLVSRHVPPDATVLVVSKGDDALLKLGGRTAWHFPCTGSGAYTGYHLADSTAACKHLEQLRRKGADYLVFPKSAFWWLEFYAGFRRHLEQHCAAVVRDAAACVIFALRKGTAHRTANQAVSERKPRSNREQGGTAMPAEQLAAEALARTPNDYDANFEVARLAWQRGRLDLVEQQLERLVQLYPADGTAPSELAKLYCARLENLAEPGQRNPLVNRLLALLADSTKKGLLTPEAHLQVAESLNSAGVTQQALASLEAALGGLNFDSRPLQRFVMRLLGPIVADKRAVPFHDELHLAAFFTHAGNGFAAVQDQFKAHAFYRLAIATGGNAADKASWPARFNLAFLEMAQGNVLRARQLLEGTNRLALDQAALVAWPGLGGCAWPHGAFPLRAAFEKLKPPGKPWPKLTVTTPSLNQAAYIEETLLSVLSQGYPALEYIVVDGASSDGTREVLEQYKNCLDKLIIEPDEGQADAINKGLRLATGEILLWLNSDDMLAPGALFQLALTYLEEGADLVAGICCGHRERRFQFLHLPATTRATFNVECLRNIHEYWLKGHYFYQPEVAFTRRILQKVGGQLDQRLTYVMDYELWLRCARAGARLSLVRWPIAFIRKHDAQKTSRVDQTLRELTRVRDRFVQREAHAARQSNRGRR